MAAFKYKHLYGTTKWGQLRRYIWQRDQYVCKWHGCGKLLIGKAPSPNSPIAHHIKPHRGNATLFWDAANIMTVCKECHDGAVQRYERTGRIGGYDKAGKPIDPQHPWNREAP